MQTIKYKQIFKSTSQ